MPLGNSSCHLWQKLVALCDCPSREALVKIIFLKSKRHKLLILFFWSCTSFSFFAVSEPFLALSSLPALILVKQSVGQERKCTNAELRSMAVTKLVRDLPVKILSQLNHIAHE